MCSVSWQFNQTGYDLFFTRDEQRSRVAAEAPVVQKTPSGLPFLAPTDPQGGGTWIFINAHGLSGCLLNAYNLASPTPEISVPRSRGQLLRSLAGAESVAAFGAQLTTATADGNYPPAYIFALARDGSIGFWLWDGYQPQIKPVPPAQFFTTSSVHPSEVRARRAARLYRELGSPPYAPQALEQFHHDRASQGSAVDLRMSRSDARSVSLTHIHCAANEQRIRYAPRDGDGPYLSPEDQTLTPTNGPPAACIPTHLATR
jgi:hypothetical protein